jgi:hypothetical protein
MGRTSIGKFHNGRPDTRKQYFAAIAIDGIPSGPHRDVRPIKRLEAPVYVPNWKPVALADLRIYQIDGGRTICRFGSLPRSSLGFTFIDLGMQNAEARTPNAVALIFGAVAGNSYCLRGPVARMLPLMQVIHFGISTMPLSFKKKAELACRFMVECARGELVGLPGNGATNGPFQLSDDAVILPQLRRIESCFVPVFLTLPPDKLISSGEVGGFNLLNWSRRRVRYRDYEFFEPLLCLEMRVPRGVFVPDMLVGELFIEALLTKHSALLRDIQGRRVAEPCTGSGYLGILLAMLGAKHVVSSDKHPQSVKAARDNAERSGLTDSVTHIQADALPAGLTDVSAIVVNPPWFDSPSKDAEFWDNDTKRCMIDLNHELLYRILSRAATVLPVGGAVWFALGGSNRPLPNKVLFDRARLDLTTSITGRSGMRLQRYVSSRIS